jgi:hypothetical protein
VIVGIDRATSTDADGEQVEEGKSTDRPPPPPSDRPGQEPEGVPSRLEARRALSAAQEQAAGRSAGATDQKVPKSTSEQGFVVAERKPDPTAASQPAEVSETSATQVTDKPQSELDSGTSGEERTNSAHGAEFVSPVQDAHGERGDGLRDSPIGARVEGEVLEGDRQPAGAQDAAAAEHTLERTDQPHEVKPPQIVRDYYTNIPPTAQDRYLVRDQSNPVPVFDGPPTRDQTVQGRVGDCGIVARPRFGGRASPRSDQGRHQTGRRR